MKQYNYITTREPSEREPNRDTGFPYEHPMFEFIFEKLVFILIAMGIAIWLNKVEPYIENFNKTLKTNKILKKQIDNYLSEINGILNADRVIFGRFHNGNFWVDGMPWIKLSAYNEVVRHEGISFIADQVKDISVEKLVDELSLLEKHSYISILRSNVSANNCARHLDSIGVGGITQLLVEDKKKRCIGIISVQYLDENDLKFVNDLDTNQYKRLFNLVEQISISIERAKKESKQGVFMKTLRRLTGRS